MNKVKLNDFIKEELDSYTKNVIITAIQNGKKQKKYKEEIIFNRYSIEILFFEKKVIIYDDIFTDNQPLKLCLDKFINAIKG